MSICTLMSRPAPATPGNRARRTRSVAAAATALLGGLALGLVATALGLGPPMPWSSVTSDGATAAGRSPAGIGWPSADVAAATLGGRWVRAFEEGGPGRPDRLLSWTTTADGHPGSFSSVPVVSLRPTTPTTAAASGAGRTISPTPTPTPAPTPTPGPTPGPTPPSGLPHTVTVVLVQPPGTKRDATTAAALATSIRTDVSRFWSGQTGGAITFSVAKSVEWVKVGVRCSDVWGLWNQAASASGFVPGLRKHLVVYVAPGGTCSPGLGTIGAGPEAGGYVYLRASKVALLAHELGHNLGLGHSNGLQCDGVPDAVWSGRWSRPCTVSDYRDWYDVMGVSWDRLGTLSTAQAYRLGVLPAARIVATTQPVAVTLNPVGSASGVVSLRVTDPTGVTYVVEYRPAVGREAWLGSRTLDWRGLRPGVLVRRTDPTRGSDPAQTLLLDATPSHRSGYAEDYDEPLGSGGTLTLGSGRLALRVVVAGATSATVAVGIDGVWPAGELSRLGGRVPGTGSSVDPSPAAVPFVGRVPAVRC